MTKKVLPDPLYPLITVDRDLPIPAKLLSEVLEKPGITLPLRSGTGDPNRGGYFFQIEVSDTGYTLHPFDKKNNSDTYSVDFSLLLKLINQMSGRLFDKEAMMYVRNVLNMPSDD